MKIYEEDFDKERAAREKTIAKLGERNIKLGEMQKKVEALEKDKKELRMQLNQQASSHLRDDLFSEEVLALLRPAEVIFILILQEYAYRQPPGHIPRGVPQDQYPQGPSQGNKAPPQGGRYHPQEQPFRRAS